jgi:hypothetical protein
VFSPILTFLSLSPANPTAWIAVPQRGHRITLHDYLSVWLRVLLRAMTVGTRCSLFSLYYHLRTLAQQLLTAAVWPTSSCTIPSIFCSIWVWSKTALQALEKGGGGGGITTYGTQIHYMDLRLTSIQADIGRGCAI